MTTQDDKILNLGEIDGKKRLLLEMVQHHWGHFFVR
jgi:hypothetical protein